MELSEFSDPSSFERFSQLLDQGFQVSPPAHYLDDFPVWSQEFVSPKNIRLCTRVSGKVASAIGIRKASLKINQQIIPIGLLGAVVTDHAFRGEGYATQLIQKAVQWAEQSGLTAIFLWGSEHSMYRRLGFELCGDQVRVPLVHLSSSVGTESFEVREGWNASTWSLLKQREEGLLLEDADLAWFEKHRNVQWLSAWKQGKIQAYAALGRGIDLHHLVHEWGGNQNALNALLDFISSKDPEAQLLGHPLDVEKRFKVELTREGVEEFLCMARILNPEKIIETVMGDVPLQVKKLGGVEERWLIQVEGEPVQNLKSAELARYLFGPRNSAHFQGSQIPLPLWFWGLDAC